MYKDIKITCYRQFLKAKKKGKKFNFRTNKLEHYKKGFKKYFRSVASLTFGVEIKCRKYGLTRNNNCIERDHQYSRKLGKNSRGYKDIDGISAVFDVGDAYHNYIYKQRLAGEKRWRTCAERVKIKLKLADKYQLLDFIKKAYAKN